MISPNYGFSDISSGGGGGGGQLTSVITDGITMVGNGDSDLAVSSAQLTFLEQSKNIVQDGANIYIFYTSGGNNNTFEFTTNDATFSASLVTGIRLVIVNTNYDKDEGINESIIPKSISYTVNSCPIIFEGAQANAPFTNSTGNLNSGIFYQFIFDSINFRLYQVPQLYAFGINTITSISTGYPASIIIVGDSEALPPVIFSMPSSQLQYIGQTFYIGNSGGITNYELSPISYNSDVLNPGEFQTFISLEDDIFRIK